MAGLNKVDLIGHVGADPEIVNFQSGGKVANFTIATSETWKDKATGEKKERTEWHRISVFSEGLIKVVQNYVKKGSKIYIQGMLQTRKWQDQSGQDRYTTEIVLKGYNSNLLLLDKKPEGSGRPPPPSENAYEGEPAPQQQAATSGAVNPNQSTVDAYSVPAGGEVEDEIPF